MDKRVRFYSRSGSVRFFFTRNEVVYSFVQQEKKDFLQKVSRSSLRVDPSPQRESKSLGHVIRLQFIGTNPAPVIEGQQELSGKVNYFIGNDPTRWKRDLPIYRQIRYQELWPGIDLIYRGQGGQLKYEFIVKTGVDPGQIRLAYQGIKGLALNDAGDLVIKTAFGELRDSRPHAYQEIGGRRSEVKVGFRVGADNPAFVHGFKVESYDPSYPLILDPGLEYSTFLGGSAGERSYGIAVDSAGSIYVTGMTGPDFPTTREAFDPFGGGVFVTKLSADGSTLVYSTFLGGLGDNRGYGIAVDADGNAYVTGITSHDSFPTTLGAFDTNFGGIYDAFVAKLSADGSTLLYSTFLGGSLGRDLTDLDTGEGIAVDALGNAYVTGWTTSSDFPTTPGAFDTSLNGSRDTFVAKLSADGSTLLYSTFLGGYSDDWGEGIAADASGNAHVTGWTYSVDFPITPEAFDTSHNGSEDVFVTKLSADGSSLLYSTFLGGDRIERKGEAGHGIALDTSGNAYITGWTASPDFPATDGAFDITFNGGADAFVAKLSPDGSSLVYATFLGGRNNDDRGYGIAVNAAGNAYVTGYTHSSDFPTTPGAFDTRYNREADAFVAQLSADGSTLLYATFLGGSVNASGHPDDRGYGIAVDTAGNAYVTGATESSDFPATAGAFDTSYNGSGDVFVVKLGPDVEVNPASFFEFGSIKVGSSSSPQTFTISNTGIADLVVGMLSVAGSDASEFAIQNDHCSNQTITPSGNCTVQAVFSPASPGGKSATLNIPSNDPDTSTATLSLTGVGNNSPVANPQAISTEEDTSVGIRLIGSDPNNDPITFMLVSNPSNGVLSGIPPNLIYRPNRNFTGSDSLAFTVNDGSLTSADAIVSIIVTPVNDPPVANDDVKSTDEDTPLTFAASELTSNDTEVDGDPLTVTAVTATDDTHGTVALVGGTVTYTPMANFNGSARFSYTVSDGQGGSNTGSVRVNVSPVNDPPGADVQRVTTDEDTRVAIALSGSDPDGNSLTFRVGTHPSNGTLSGTAPHLTYIPTADFSGSDSFTFQVGDGTIDSDPVTVTITVSPVNDAPLLASIGNKDVDETELLTFNVSASDVEGDPLTYSASNLPPGAGFDPVTRTFSWTAGFDQAGNYPNVRFEVTDGKLSDAEEIEITVVNLNRPPFASRNLSPSIGATGVSLTPTLTSSSFSDLDTEDTHRASQWQITDLPGDYSNPVYDSGEDRNHRTSLPIPSGTLLPSVTYFWRVRHQDSTGGWSDWSAETHFTPLSSEEAALAHLYEVMDSYKTGATPRLLESYRATPTFISQKNVAYLYDNALALLAFLAWEDEKSLSQAKILADSFLFLQQNDPVFQDGRLRDAYTADDLSDSSGKALIQTPSSSTGNLAWAIIALVRYWEVAGGVEHLEAAEKLGEWIVGNALDDRGAGGFTGGIDAKLKPIRWKATEHNIDLYAAFQLLYEATQDRRWLGWANYARRFMEALWDEPVGFFWTGTLEDGETINWEPIPLDVQAWATLALGEKHAEGLTWIRKNLWREPCECGQFRGYQFSTRGEGCWFEGTAHVALALQQQGNFSEADGLFQSLQDVQAWASNGDGQGIVAACSDEVETGYGFSYYNALHVGATSWYLLARKGFNPLETSPVQTYTVSGLIRDSKKAPRPGVMVEARDSEGSLVGMALTDGQGGYRLDFPPGRYVLTPIKETHVFSPASRKITVKNKDVGKQNFTCKLFQISGTVKDRKNKPLPEVTVHLKQDGSTVDSSTTDAKGKYAFWFYNTGPYIVEPVKEGHDFNPPQIEVAITKGSKGGVNFKEAL